MRTLPEGDCSRAGAGPSRRRTALAKPGGDQNVAAPQHPPSRRRGAGGDQPAANPLTPIYDTYYPNDFDYRLAGMALPVRLSMRLYGFKPIGCARGVRGVQRPPRARTAPEGTRGRRKNQTFYPTPDTFRSPCATFFAFAACDLARLSARLRRRPTSPGRRGTIVGSVGRRTRHFVFGQPLESQCVAANRTLCVGCRAARVVGRPRRGKRAPRADPALACRRLRYNRRPVR
jgi:hypothetical protein